MIGVGYDNMTSQDQLIIFPQTHLLWYDKKVRHYITEYVINQKLTLITSFHYRSNLKNLFKSLKHFLLLYSICLLLYSLINREITFDVYKKAHIRQSLAFPQNFIQIYKFESHNSLENFS